MWLGHLQRLQLVNVMSQMDFCTIPFCCHAQEPHHTCPEGRDREIPPVLIWPPCWLSGCSSLPLMNHSPSFSRLFLANFEFLFSLSTEEYKKTLNSQDFLHPYCPLWVAPHLLLCCLWKDSGFFKHCQECSSQLSPTMATRSASYAGGKPIWSIPAFTAGSSWNKSKETRAVWPKTALIESAIL